MAALHGRSLEVAERLAVLASFGHTPESAFRAMYRELDVRAWLRDAGIPEHVVHAVLTWRGRVELREYRG